MKSLVVIDCQYDFVYPNGSLCVEGAIDACSNIVDFISKKEIDEVIFTVDFHRLDDKSFEINGGQWPIHCLQYTAGAVIVPGLMAECVNSDIPWKVLRKGEMPEVEEYGAFNEIKSINGDGVLRLSSKTHSVYTTSDEFIVCGVAGDYCVKESLKGLLRLPTYCKLSVLMDGIASIDGGESLNQFLASNKIINIL